MTSIATEPPHTIPFEGGVRLYYFDGKPEHVEIPVQWTQDMDHFEVSEDSRVGFDQVGSWILAEHGLALEGQLMDEFDWDRDCFVVYVEGSVPTV